MAMYINILGDYNVSIKEKNVIFNQRYNSETCVLHLISLLNRTLERRLNCLWDRERKEGF